MTFIMNSNATARKTPNSGRIQHLSKSTSNSILATFAPQRQAKGHTQITRVSFSFAQVLKSSL